VGSGGVEEVVKRDSAVESEEMIFPSSEDSIENKDC
jgi:hypothetical protein